MLKGRWDGYGFGNLGLEVMVLSSTELYLDLSGEERDMVNMGGIGALIRVELRVYGLVLFGKSEI